MNIRDKHCPCAAIVEDGPLVTRNDEKLDFFFYFCVVTYRERSVGQESRAAAASQDKHSFHSRLQAEPFWVGSCRKNLWANGQARHSELAGPQPAGRLGISQEYCSGKRRKESRNQPRKEILFVQKDGNSEESPRQKRPKRSVATNANDPIGAHGQNNIKRLAQRDRQQSQGEQRPKEPAMTLAGAGHPPNAKTVKLDPRMSRHDLGFEPVTTSHVHEPYTRLCAPQTFQQSQSGVEMPPRPAPTDEYSLHKGPFWRY